MSSPTSQQAFATAATSMVHAVPVGDILSRLVRDCVDVVDAAADAAILVRDRDDALTLLTSSSAAAAQLELLQSMDAAGPCVDVIRTGAIHAAIGEGEITRRWGEVGSAIVQAGFRSVHAYPLSWHGRVLGGLNVFGRTRPAEPSRLDEVCQAFADVATVVLVHDADVPADELTTRIHRATSARSLVEQAKGVLSELHGLDLESAAARLERMAAMEGLALSDAAQRVVDRAARRTAPPGSSSPR